VKILPYQKFCAMLRFVSILLCWGVSFSGVQATVRNSETPETTGVTRDIGDLALVDKYLSDYFLEAPSFVMISKMQLRSLLRIASIDTEICQIVIRELQASFECILERAIPNARCEGLHTLITASQVLMNPHLSPDARKRGFMVFYDPKVELPWGSEYSWVKCYSYDESPSAVLLELNIRSIKGLMMMSHISNDLLYTALLKLFYQKSKSIDSAEASPDSVAFYKSKFREVAQYAIPVPNWRMETIGFGTSEAVREALERFSFDTREYSI
jgi:hypothetical protein